MRGLPKLRPRPFASFQLFRFLCRFYKYCELVRVGYVQAFFDGTPCVEDSFLANTICKNALTVTGLNLETATGGTLWLTNYHRFPMTMQLLNPTSMPKP